MSNEIKAAIIGAFAVIIAALIPVVIRYCSNPDIKDEVSFRINQIDEVFNSAIKFQTDCFDQLAKDGSVKGSTIRDYLNSTQIVTTAMELGGIYRIPAKDNDTFVIGSSGYGVHQLPNRKTFKHSAYMEYNLSDLVSKIVSSKSSTDVEISLDKIKHYAQFSEIDVVSDWFNREQSSSYGILQLRVNDYDDELLRVKKWLDNLYNEWQQFKKLF